MGAVPGSSASATAAGSASASSAHAALSSAVAALAPPSIRLGASWQVNKNALLKVRIQDDAVSALLSVKSWWDPSASAALSVNHSFATSRSSVGLSVDIENVGEVLFSRPDPAYKRMVASQREHIENLVQQDEDYYRH